ncbi:MAG TPA: acyltransferase domain-containing protein, partial [Isosphaeraceae bacterium]
FAGLLLNVAAGRITNRLDLGGLNFTVDAACASSLAAVHLAVRELEAGGSDAVIVGGVDTVQTPFGYLCFSKTHALSPTGRPRTFDADSDGITISEGIVMLVLKRLDDAERDGDRIYAVIQGVAGSSDGRAKGMTAPRAEGQRLALERAYAKAGVPPTTVGLFEAHGTGTAVGDRTEALALAAFLDDHGARAGGHAIGSVKSMIGHTKATAGVAALAKVALALHHKVLLPTLGVTNPNPKARLDDGPLYVNGAVRPWVHAQAGHPRRAGVSAFGFGGTNFHAVVEEYADDYLPRRAVSPRQLSELLLWSAETPAGLAASVETVERALADGAEPAMHDLAFSLASDWARRPGSDRARLAIVAGSLDDLKQKLTAARERLTEGGSLSDRRGIYYRDSPPEGRGRVAWLFPGQGSQYPNMLGDLAVRFDIVRESFERFDRALEARFPEPLSRLVFPRPAFRPEQEAAQREVLARTDVAQPALGAAGVALARLLGELGMSPDLTAGRSYGEYVALHAAGVLDADTLALLSEARGRSIIEAAERDLGTMLAASRDPRKVSEVLAGVGEVWVANHNSPEQTILSGTAAGIAEAARRLQTAGVSVRSLAVSCAFHSPIVAPAQARLSEHLARVRFRPPALPVYSNTTAGPYPDDPDEIAGRLAEHLVSPVRFAEEVEAMYEAGARVFVEVGPRQVLTGLVRQCLGDRPHLAVALDAPGRPGVTQLHDALGALAAEGVGLDPTALFLDRPVRRLNLNALVAETRPRPLPASCWMVNGGRSRPAHQPPRPLLHAPLAALLEEGPMSPAPAEIHATNGHAPRPHPVELAPALAGVDFTPGVAPSPPDDDAGMVLDSYIRLMDRVVSSQREAMLGYLRGTAAPHRNGSTPHPPPAAGTLLAPRANGVATSAATNVAEPVVPKESEVEQVAGSVPDRDRLTTILLGIVSERTGYPPEMLDLDVDLEAELGVDSIKRTEILGAFQGAALPAGRSLAAEEMERL